MESFKVRINDIILEENSPKTDKHTEQEQIILYIYISEIVFPAEIVGIATAFYQYSNERKETKNTVLKINLKVEEEILSKKIGFCV